MTPITILVARVRTSVTPLKWTVGDMMVWLVVGGMGETGFAGDGRTEGDNRREYSPD